MSYEIALTYVDLPLFYNIDLDHIVRQISKIMGQNRVTREPYDKAILINKKIYYSEEAPLVLLLEKSFLNL